MPRLRSIDVDLPVIAIENLILRQMCFRCPCESLSLLDVMGGRIGLRFRLMSVVRLFVSMPSFFRFCPSGGGAD